MIFRIFVTIATSVSLVCTQQTLYPYPPGKVTWKPSQNGMEGTYMQFTEDWKREIVAWAKECIFEIRNKMFQLDQINWGSADDLRYQIGETIGRIYEIHRQQMDMYRRMKRGFENRFNWIRPELAGRYPQVKLDGVVEPVPGSPQRFGYPWEQMHPSNNDYKPHVYIVALEYITKKEVEIEQLVRLLINFEGEEEIARFKPHLLPADEDGPVVWAGYATHRARTDFPIHEFYLRVHHHTAASTRPTAGYRPLIDEREREVVPTLAQCCLGTSHTPLNFSQMYDEVILNESI